MAIANYKTFVEGEVLFAADLNGLQSYFTGNATALVSPFTATVDLNGNILVLDTDGDSTLRETSDDVIALRLQGVDVFIFDGDVATPANGLTFRSSAASSSPEIAAQGSDTNVGIRLLPKGTGLVLGASSGLGSYSYTFDSSTSMADPGTGDFRLNNATPSSVTAIAISDTDYLGYDRDAVLDGISGFPIRIAQLANPTTFVNYHVFGVTDNGTWHQLDVVYKGTSGTLSNGDVCAVVIDSVGREELAANVTLYVRTDGNDSNSGRVNTAAGAFLTVQAAVNKCYTIEQNGFTITISVGAGTYTGTVSVNKRFTGLVTILGDATTPANVIFSTTSATAVTCTNPGSLISLSGIKFQTATSGHGILCTNYGAINVTGLCDFGACANSQISAQTGGNITVTANVNITGNAQYHYLVQYGGSIACAGVTVTLTGTPAFSQAFAVATSGHGRLQVNGNTFTGGATGNRFTVAQLSFIETAGGGANYFPGNAAGTTDAATFGVYN